MTSLGAPATSRGAPRITVEQSGKNDIFYGNAAGAPGNHSYYLLFNDFQNSCIQFVFSSMYLYSYPSTHGMSGLAAGGVSEPIQGAPENDDSVNSEVHSEAVIELVWKWTWKQ